MREVKFILLSSFLDSIRSSIHLALSSKQCLRFRHRSDTKKLCHLFRIKQQTKNKVQRITKMDEDLRIEQPFPDEPKEVIRWITLFVRFTLRSCFEINVYEHCGYFLDRPMSRIVFEYWNWVRYEEGTHQLSEHTAIVNRVVLSTLGRYAYTASEDGLIRQWDLTNNAVIQKWKAHENGVRCLDFSKGKLVSSGMDLRLLVWDGYTRDLIIELGGHPVEITCARFNHKGNLIVTGSHDMTLRLWSVDQTECLRTLGGHQSPISSVMFTGVSDRIVSASHDFNVRFWSANSGDECIKSVTTEDDSVVLQMSINCDRTLVAWMTDVPHIHVYQMPEMDSIVHIIADCTVAGCFHPWIPHVIAVSDEFRLKLKLLDLKSHGSIDFTGHSEMISQIAFSPDGSRVLSVSDDESVRVWPIEKEILNRILNGDELEMDLTGEIIDKALESTPSLFGDDGSSSD